jgi:hypothetical protein
MMKKTGIKSDQDAKVLVKDFNESTENEIEDYLADYCLTENNYINVKLFMRENPFLKTLEDVRNYFNRLV